MTAPHRDPQSLADLTPAQQKAVTHVDGPLLVLAAAGSGKTRVITRRVAYMLSRGIEGSNILALTFTNKAAGEMRERIGKLVPNSNVWVGTFHALGAKLLRTHAPLVGLDHSFTILDQADRLRTIKEVIEARKIDTLGVPPERIEAIISRAKNAMTSPEKLLGGADDLIAKAVVPVYKRYQERLREQSAVDFDDLLVHIVTILRDHPDLRARLDAQYKYILVDEYQDTNMAQYAILRGLSRDHPNLCVTGDPDQAIYAWRGANLNNILEFENDYPGCKVVKLEQNYRSTKTILYVADYLIQHNTQRKPKDLVTDNAHGEPVEISVYLDDHEEARGVASRIVDLTRHDGFSPRDVAVFCRVTALTRNLEQALRSASVPYQVVGTVSFFDRQEVKDVLAYLSLVINPRNDVAFDRVVNVPQRGIGKTSLDHLAEWARRKGIPRLAAAARAREIPELKPKAIDALVDFAAGIDRIAKHPTASAKEGVERVLRAVGYREYLKLSGLSKADDRNANVDELITAAAEFDSANRDGSIAGFLEQITLMTSVDRWADDSGAVTLMTLHAAKGLEFPVVFIVGVENQLLPHSRSQDHPDQVEEERRLFFVGITRARQKLFLSHCANRVVKGRSMYASPSPFLDELPADAIVVRDTTGGRRASSQWDSHSNSNTDWRYGNNQNRSSYAPPPPPRSYQKPRSSAVNFGLKTAAEHAAGASAASSPPVDLDRFQPGVSVRHPSYGLGRIVAIEGAGPNRKGRVAFVVGGERTFVLAKSPLKPI
jgi:DNA helicase-2/ATP-dependent DNA helicase PcrA